MLGRCKVINSPFCGSYHSWCEHIVTKLGLVCHSQNATITWILLTFQHVYGLKSLQFPYSFTYVNLSIVHV
jgi:hypothetical protein